MNLTNNENAFLTRIRGRFIKQMAAFDELDDLQYASRIGEKGSERYLQYQKSMIVNASLMPLAQLFFMTRSIPYPLKNNNSRQLEDEFLAFCKPYGDSRRDCGISMKQIMESV